MSTNKIFGVIAITMIFGVTVLIIKPGSDEGLSNSKSQKDSRWQTLKEEARKIHKIETSKDYDSALALLGKMKGLGPEVDYIKLLEDYEKKENPPSFS